MINVWGYVNSTLQNIKIHIFSLINLMYYLHTFTIISMKILKTIRLIFVSTIFLTFSLNLAGESQYFKRTSSIKQVKFSPIVTTITFDRETWKLNWASSLFPCLWLVGYIKKPLLIGRKINQKPLWTWAKIFSCSVLPEIFFQFMN